MPPNLKNQSNSSHYAEGNATLAAGQTYKGPVHDTMPGFARVRATIFQDQAGATTGLQIEQSNDPTFGAGAGNVITSTAAPITANTQLSTGDLLVYRRYVRVSANNSSGSPLTIQNIDLVFVTT